jgi:hypothetical protein
MFTAACGDRSGHDELRGSGIGIDSGGDASADMGLRLCYGTAPFDICLPTAPSTSLTISSDTIVDTKTSPMCTAVGDLCVIAGTTISIQATLRATGPNPLVLLASDSITIETGGSIDVGSHRGTNAEFGAGTGPVECSEGIPPSSGCRLCGGGAGGSFGGLGGTGGKGGNDGNGGAPAAAVLSTSFRGGCPGQDSRGFAVSKGLQGNGGGAVLLIAGGFIEHAGSINAGGEGGTGGVDSGAGGGGGGSGGMIVLDAPTITGDGLIVANGGGGGEGAEDAISGHDGSEPVGVAAAIGGAGGTANGGDGGNGSAGAAAGPGATGMNGTSTGGGGGGGGGAGFIMARMGASLGPQVSPAPTFFAATQNN